MLTLPATSNLRSDPSSVLDPAGSSGAGSKPDFPGRRQRALAVARRVDGRVDALVICDPKDIRYLTGASQGISWLVVQDNSAFAVSRHMLVSEARQEAADCEILLPCDRSTERPDLELFVARQLAAHGARVVTLDPARVTARSYLGFTGHAAKAGLEVADIPELLSPVRAVKDPVEIALTMRCVWIAEQAFAGLLDQGAAALIGRSERDLANELKVRMWELGADRQGFPETGIIVASGPNSASAHHSPGQRRVAAGEALLFDWGAELDGYRSDITRTVFPQRVPEFAMQAYPVVEQALQRAVERLRAGAAMGEIDRAARETVTAAGYQEFHYGVGHGVGLAIHEAPWLRADSTEALEADMLTTVEPGVYLPGTGGIRIENVYRVVADGCERLGSLPTTLADMVVA